MYDVGGTAVTAMAAVDEVGSWSDGELQAAAVELAGVVSRLSGRLAAVLGELEVRGVCEREHGLSVGSWLARESGSSVGGARAMVRTGRVVRRFPALWSAVSSGVVSFDHATVLARAVNPRVIDQLAELDDTLVELAGDRSFERWRDDVRGLVALVDQDGGYDPAEDVGANRVSVVETIDGITYLSGQLVGEAGRCVRAALDAKADELFRRCRRDADQTGELAVPGRATLVALALAELCRTGQAVDLDATRPPRPEVTLVVDAGDPTTVCDERGVRLADGTTRTLRCDADLQAVVVDSLGVPIDVGRHVRWATVAQRRALAVRDGGCVFPGCDLPAHWCDAHHVEPFEAGGRTDLANLVSLCRTHHGITHRTGWTMTLDESGWATWTTPGGHTLHSHRRGKRRPDHAAA